MSRLPLELYDFIIPPLRKDRDSLKALSLTWKVFLPFAQRQLFSHVIIRPRRKCVREFHEVSGAPSEFRQLLDMSPHIGEYVKSLEICDWTDSRHEQCNLHSQRASDCNLLDDSDLPSCLMRLTTLQALAMSRVSFDSHAPQTLLHSIINVVQLPSLVHLELGDSPALSAVYNASRNLKHLIISWSGNHYVSEFIIEPPDHPLVLHSLCIKQYLDMDIVIMSLMAPESRVSLQGLKKLTAIVGIYVEQYENLGILLDACRGSLEEFCLVGHEPPEPDIEPLFHLKHLSSLKRLHMKIMNIGNLSDDDTRDQLRWFKGFLCRSLTEPRPLEELSIEQNVSYYEDDAEAYLSNLASGWREVTDILLDRSLLPRLRKFKLHIFSGNKSRAGQAASTVDFLKSCDFAEQLNSNLESFVIRAQAFGCCIVANFVEDHEWLSMDDCYDFRQSQISIT